MATALHLESSRAIPVKVEAAFDHLLPHPLTELMSRRYGPLPPIREVRDQAGTWGEVGQTRTIVLTDGGTMREQLTEVVRPHHFAYRLTDITGPLRPLVSGVEGRWAFAPVGTGVLVTWSWVLHPTSGYAARVLPLVGRLWRGYARQALEETSDVLVAGAVSPG
ncbi:polyketide cyclase/dehydrase/lipid transport protein [Humibacillus xanthopallidus]|uniref:Polyketide cyclase/dehydrase/lipid transport protein n=1 Tax=Humibacillus xanthopallidus TaxID=412689 RepID=A0A543PN38_9MICO|nr:SRPBCC family protein [Humibacillus xanthopallidus]TQN45501.1 polyketide cyclase/dehydrase/lipid transport protein [Humibacillus xanthopallidus]